MKRMLKMGLLGLLAMELLVSCEKEENVREHEKSYTETAFGLNMRMIYVEGGTFEMGDDAYVNEKPVRLIRLDSSYYIGKYEITQAQWKAVMGTSLEDQLALATNSYGIVGKGDNYPMYYVSWNDAQEFCRKLSDSTGRKYVLPTEAMWEYAARGGNKSKHFKYSGSNDLGNVAWYDKNSDEKAHPVGRKKANELGIYDMSGNVWEWCSDWYGSYDENDVNNPQGPATGQFRVYRGGGWSRIAGDCRVSCRRNAPANNRPLNLGFRVAVML